MKYFKLDLDFEPKVIGVRNGLHQGEIIWKNFKSKTAEKDLLSEIFTVPKYIANQIQELPIGIEIEYVKAYKMAKMTDIFGFFPALFGINYFFSPKFKEVLERFNLPYVQFIPVQIYQEEQHFQYWAPYMPIHFREDSFNLQKSVFRDKGLSLLEPKKYIEINNIEDYKKARFFEPEKLVFNSKFDKTLDMFKYVFGGGCYIISEQLKNAIVEAKLTGIVIKEDFEPRIYVE